MLFLANRLKFFRCWPKNIFGWARSFPLVPFLLKRSDGKVFGPSTKNPFYGGYNKMAQKVQFVETVLRDANQSLIATRLPFEKFEPMLETIDQAGYYAIECWGGATFDVCLRYLNEDPWERLRKIRA